MEDQNYFPIIYTRKSFIPYRVYPKEYTICSISVFRETQPPLRTSADLGVPRFGLCPTARSRQTQCRNTQDVTALSLFSLLCVLRDHGPDHVDRRAAGYDFQTEELSDFETGRDAVPAGDKRARSDVEVQGRAGEGREAGGNTQLAAGGDRDVVCRATDTDIDARTGVPAGCTSRRIPSCRIFPPGPAGWRHGRQGAEPTGQLCQLSRLNAELLQLVVPPHPPLSTTSPRTRSRPAAITSSARW